MPTVEEWELADDVLAELSKYRAKVTEARNKVETEKRVAGNRGPTYLQNRAMKSIDYHDRSLETLEKEFSDKKAKLEQALADLETEKQKKREFHEQAIEEAKKNLDYKSASLVRAEDVLESAIVARDKYLESAKQNHVPEKKPSVTVTLPPYKTVIKPIIPPVEDEKVYYDPEGNICSKWEYELRLKKIEREKIEREKHTHEENAMCVSYEPLRQKKPLKTIQKRIIIQDTPNTPRSEAILQDLIQSLDTE